MYEFDKPEAYFPPVHVSDTPSCESSSPGVLIWTCDNRRVSIVVKHLIWNQIGYGQGHCSGVRSGRNLWEIVGAGGFRSLKTVFQERRETIKLIEFGGENMNKSFFCLGI